MRKHIEDVILEFVTPTNPLYIELRNGRLAGPEVTTQDVVRAIHILDDNGVQVPITVNSNLFNPIRLEFDGVQLESEIGGVMSGVTMLNALEEFVRWFEVTCYFEQGDNAYVIDDDMSYKIVKRGSTEGE